MGSVFPTKISPSDTFPSVLSPVRFHMNCEAVFGHCEHEWVKNLPLENALECEQHNQPTERIEHPVIGLPRIDLQSQRLLPNRHNATNVSQTNGNVGPIFVHKCYVLHQKTFLYPIVVAKMFFIIKRYIFEKNHHSEKICMRSVNNNITTNLPSNLFKTSIFFLSLTNSFILRVAKTSLTILEIFF